MPDPESPEPGSGAALPDAENDGPADATAGAAASVDPGRDAGSASVPEDAEAVPFVSLRASRDHILAASREVVAETQAILARLRRVALDLPALDDEVARVTITAFDAFEAIGAIAVRIADVDDADTRLEIVGSARLPSDACAALDRAPHTAALPWAVAARTGAFVACNGRQDMVDAFPALADLLDRVGAQALCSVPAQHLGQQHGAFMLLFATPRSWTATHRAQLRAMGRQLARAMFHARRLFAERDARLHAERAQGEAELSRREAQAARAALEAARATLEARIAERTLELARLNTALTSEIAERVRADEERRMLARQLATAEEEERRRVARELHDQLGQHLAALALGLAEVDSMLPADAPARPRLAALQALARTMTNDVRHLALELRPPELDDLGLASALETHVAQWGERYGVEVETELTALRVQALPAELSTTLYRITQEALTNVARHARAGHVSILAEMVDGEMRLIVEDDGDGFDVEVTTRRAAGERRLGLAGMRERAALAGGTLSVESTPGAGTALYVRLPLDVEAARDGTADERG